MQSLGNTILNSVINSIVQVGVEMLKNFHPVPDAGCGDSGSKHSIRYCRRGCGPRSLDASSNCRLNRYWRKQLRRQA
ncbi:phage tape measure protein [Klebsiella pneumoniae]|nr:phage tape measure protein [Klebsiella pneumoniae]